MFKGANGIAEIAEWWRAVQDELIRFKTLSNGPGQWGRTPATTYSMNDWESLGRRFEEYSGRMGGNANAGRANSSERRPAVYETAAN